MSYKVMVNGIPGKMGIEVANVVLARGLELFPYSLTGSNVTEKSFQIGDKTVELITPEERNILLDVIKEENILVVDYTHPSAVNSNAEFYIQNNLPFVMGTTGGDRDKLINDVSDAGLYAVIAPNMAKQIVALQAMMEFAAKSFPGVFKGWNLSVIESHQSTKADTSGTAKAIVSSFKEMGLEFDVEDIELVREENAQIEVMKVPKDHLKGHAFHTYSVDSADKSVHFEFQHNVAGRSIYAEGTVDAVQFLAEKIQENSEQKLFNMIDVLNSGKMS